MIIPFVPLFCFQGCMACKCLCVNEIMPYCPLLTEVSSLCSSENMCKHTQTPGAYSNSLSCQKLLQEVLSTRNFFNGFCN